MTFSHVLQTRVQSPELVFRESCGGMFRSDTTPAHRQIPELHDTIIPTRHDPSSIGRENYLTHTLRMPFVSLDARLATNIPDFQIGVDRARGEELTVRVPLRVITPADHQMGC